MDTLQDPIEIVRELVALPGPPGQEDAVSESVRGRAESLTCLTREDALGNLLISLPGADELPERAEIVVMAHMDEIALVVVGIDHGGRLLVTNLGGLYPWKWGEGPVEILCPGQPLVGILSFGSVHTNSPASPVTKARDGALTWDNVRVFTGLPPAFLSARGVRPGTRVVLARSRRNIVEFENFVAGPFLDDRADLAAMLLVLEMVKGKGLDTRKIVFAATASEEVGGHGALYLLRALQPTIGIALEIGPIVPECPMELDEQPTVWVNDGYSSVQARDIDLVASVAKQCGFRPHWQALSRGGSDASCAASHGLVARPITLAFATENSHGFEIMHKHAVKNLAILLVALLERLNGVAEQ